MALNAIQTHEEICKWIASSKTEQQLDVLTLFVADTFSKRFPESENVLHAQMITNMLAKIEEKKNGLHVSESVGQRFPADDEHIEHTSPVNDKSGH